jgi:hypothetical protein
MFIRNLFFIVVLSASMWSVAMYDAQMTQMMDTAIALPSKEELKTALCNGGFESFVIFSKLHEILGGHATLSPIKIIGMIDSCIQHYNACHLSWITKGERQKIVQIVLSNVPEVCQGVLMYERTHYSMRSRL